MLIMLDLDNTLADRHGAVSAWAVELRAEHQLPAGAEEWILDADNDGYSDRRSVLTAITEHFRLSVEVDELLGRYQRRVVELMVATPGAHQCLVSLRELGHQLAIVTNGSSQQQQAKIDALDLRTLVDGVCVSAEFGIKKPDAGLFEAAAVATGTTLDGAWMVGDSPHHDIGGAARLGLSTAWIRRGRPWTEGGYEPTVSIDSLTELVAAVDQ